MMSLSCRSLREALSNSSLSYSRLSMSIIIGGQRRQSNITKNQVFLQHFIGNLQPFEADVSLVERPLPFLPQNVSYSHQHKHSAVVHVVLLGIVHSHHYFVLLLVKHLCEFQSVLENRVVQVVVLSMFHTVMDHNLPCLEDSEVPMIAVVDGHHKGVSLVQGLFLQHSLDLRLCLLEGARGKVAVEYSKGGHNFLDQLFFHHFDVDVDDIVVEPFSVVQASEGLVGEFLYAVEAGDFDLAVTFVPSAPVLPDEFVLLVLDEGIFGLFVPIFELEVVAYILLVLFFQFKFPPSLQIRLFGFGFCNNQEFGVFSVFLFESDISDTHFLKGLCQLVHFFDQVCVEFLLFQLF